MKSEVPANTADKIYIQRFRLGKLFDIKPATNRMTVLAAPIADILHAAVSIGIPRDTMYAGRNVKAITYPTPNMNAEEIIRYNMGLFHRSRSRYTPQIPPFFSC